MYERIRAHKYSVLLFGLIAIISIVLFKENLDIGPTFTTLLVSVTLTYSLFMSVILWLIQTRFVRVRDKQAIMFARFQSMLQLSKLVSPSFHKKAIAKIDNFIIGMTEHKLRAYTETEKISYEFYELLNELDVHVKKQELIFARLVNIFITISESREIIELYRKRVLSDHLKTLYAAINMLTIVIFTISISTVGTIYAAIFIVYLFFFIYFSYFVKEIDDLRFGVMVAKHDNTMQLYEALQKPPYFPDVAYIYHHDLNIRNGAKIRIKDKTGKIVTTTFNKQKFVRKYGFK